MSRRIVMSLPIALVVGLVSVQAAVARPDDQKLAAALKSAAVQTSSSTPITSEKTAGLVQVPQSSTSPVIVSEKTTGLVQPFTADHTTLVASRDSFDWDDAGIGAGAVFGTMLLGAAGVLTLRRRHGMLAP